MNTDVRDARTLPEEGFHEIQLSGKQLVFLFMATTVVSVVIFLCGVLVGRGVRPSGVEAAAVAASAGMDGAGAGTEAPSSGESPADSPPAADQPPSYYGNLVADAPPAESVTPAAEARPAPAPPVAAPARTADARPALATPTDEPWIVQVTALKRRGEAEAVAKRLSSRGYKAYVLEPQPGSTVLYRVRVGPFADRSDAEQTMKRLTTEEQFKPWISR